MPPDPTHPPLPILDYQFPGNEKAVRLRRFSSALEANLAKLALESAGIETRIVGDILDAGMAGYGSPARGVDLLVRQSDLEPAAAVLRAIDDSRQKRHAAEVARLACPICGAAQSLSYDRLRFRIASLLLSLALISFFLPSGLDSPDAAKYSFGVSVLFALIGLPILISGVGRRTCLQCKHAWRPPDSDDSDSEN